MQSRRPQPKALKSCTKLRHGPEAMCPKKTTSKTVGRRPGSPSGIFCLQEGPDEALQTAFRKPYDKRPPKHTTTSNTQPTEVAVASAVHWTLNPAGASERFSFKVSVVGWVVHWPGSGSKRNGPTKENRRSRNTV